MSRIIALVLTALMLPIGAAAQPDVGDRENPVPMGEARDIDLWTVRIVSYDPDAAEWVLSHNQFNREPEDGNVLIIVGLEITYNGKTSSNAVQVGQFARFVGESSVGYSDGYCGVIPDSRTVEKIAFPGGTAFVNLCEEVTVEDAASLQLFMETPDGYVFFALDPEYVDEPAATPAA